jgi:hypothetical protein
MSSCTPFILKYSLVDVSINKIAGDCLDMLDHLFLYLETP